MARRTIKGSNGSTWIGDISRDLRVVAANGSISVDHSHATVVAKTANGDVTLGDVEGGTVVAHTAMGRVDIGIREGVAAWLDLDTKFGKVYNDLESGGPSATRCANRRSPCADLLRRYHHPSGGRDPDCGRDVSARLAVQVTGVRKSFGEKVVLDGIDLTIAEGTVFALLGPNGAGKTTTVQILSTLLRADAGDIKVAGFDAQPRAAEGPRCDRRHRAVLSGGLPPEREGEPAPDG